MRPLSDDERRIVLLFKLYQKQHRVGAPWSWVRNQIGYSEYEFRITMQRLIYIRAVHYRRNVPGSTFATDKGVQAAVQKKAA